MDNFETKTPRSAVVTGASSGIGQATVRALRDQGWTVFAVARRADRLEALAKETGAVSVPADVSVQTDVDVLAKTVQVAGGADTLINCAGGARRPSTGPKQWMKIGNSCGRQMSWELCA